MANKIVIINVTHPVDWGVEAIEQNSALEHC